MRRNLALAAALITICGCGRSQQEAKSAALRTDLAEMRKAIQDFRADKQRPPHDLPELVTAHYLRAIPYDPVTQAVDWRVTTEEHVPVASDFSTAPAAANAPSGLIDVHSAAPGRDAHGKPWSEY